MIPATAGHTWKRSTTGLWHQFADESVPDDELVIDTRCGKLAVLKPGDGGELCPKCLLSSPADQLADRMESRASTLPSVALATPNAELGLAAPVQGVP